MQLMELETKLREKKKKRFSIWRDGCLGYRALGRRRMKKQQERKPSKKHPDF